MPFVRVDELIKGDYIKINGDYIDNPILKQRLHNTWTFFSSSHMSELSGLIMISNYTPMSRGWSDVTKSIISISCSSIIMETNSDTMIEIEHRPLSKIRRFLVRYDDR